MEYKYDSFLKDDYYHGSPLRLKTDVTYALAGDSAVEDFFQLWHRLDSPVRYSSEPVFEANEAYEGGSITSAAVFRHGGRLVMLYTGAPFELSGEKRTALCYAESTDGVSFIRPCAGKTELGGNVLALFGSDGAKVSAVSLGDGRTAVMINGGGKIMLVITDDPRSLDLSSAAVIAPSDNGEFVPRLVYDESRAKWQAFVRPISGAKPSWLPADTFNTQNTVYTRRIAMTESDDLVSWSPIREIYKPDAETGFTEADSVLFSSVGDSAAAFIGLSNADYKYLSDNRYSSVYLAFGKDASSLALSEPKEPIFVHGEPDAFDADGVTMACGPLDLFGDGRDYYYYIGLSVGIEAKHPKTAVGLMSFAHGRLASRWGTRFGGWLLTKEFYMDGSSIEIDADVPKTGEIVAEIRYCDNGQIRGGRDIIGFSVGEFDKISGKNGRILLSWNGNSDVSRLRGMSVVIRFGIKNAKLYGFTVKK